MEEKSGQRVILEQEAPLHSCCRIAKKPKGGIDL